MDGRHHQNLVKQAQGLRPIRTAMVHPVDEVPLLGTGRRCGNLDGGVILYLMEEKGMIADAIGDLLYNASGLLGVSGLSDDMKALLVSSRPQAAEAVDLFVYRILRELGSLAAALGGLDALVFTAGSGEHAPEIRRRVCEQAGWFGLDLTGKPMPTAGLPSRGARFPLIDSGVG